ncbi:MAG: class I SAM-dependent methyltransferase [Promethearchaeota archaeon]
MGNTQIKARPRYNTWIRKKKIITFWILTLICLILSILAVYSIYFIVLFIPTFIFGYIAVIITLTNYQFSEKGGNYQNFIHEKFIERLKGEKKIIDVGCGNGNLIIKAAKQNKMSDFVGVDYWGSDWEYSKKQCMKNAELEGVKNIVFKKGTASNLEFNDSEFNAAMSCLTFHEVKDTKDKTKCVTEIIRILKNNGKFILFDLFDNKKFYPDTKLAKMKVEENGGIIEESKLLSEYTKLPFPLNTKKVLKHGRFIIGHKK